MSLEIEIARRETALSQSRPKYRRVLEETQSFDYLPIVDIIFRYREGESAEKAIFVLAQCQAILHEQYRKLTFVKNYENREEQLDNLKNSPQLPIS